MVAGRVEETIDTLSTLLDSSSSMKERAPASPPDINSRIARRVRDLRTQLGMTLDELAGKCDVSR